MSRTIWECAKAAPLLSACIILSLFRIWVSWLLGNVIPAGDNSDSLLMMEYANVFDHVWAPSDTSLVKTMSYPLFLLLPTMCGISYNVLLSLLWIVAGVACVCALKRVFADKRFLAFAFLFVIWTPIAFEVWGGVRVYRNAVIAPSLFLLFPLLFLLVSNCLSEKLRVSRILSTGIFAGVAFLFSFYLKEDGFWMLPLLFMVIAVCIVLIAFGMMQKRLQRNRAIALLVACLLPFGIFQAGTAVYKEFNNHYFGVSEVNTRTEGELGEFVKNVYRIDSDARTKYVWAPYDAIERAFDASPTLAEHPELEENLLNNSWFKQEEGQAPIPGDFLGWVIRTSLVETGLWESEAQVQALFAQVNDEIEEAFVGGSLPREDGMSLVSSAGARTFDEVCDLADDTLLTASSPITFIGYRMDAAAYRNAGVVDPEEAQQYLLNQYGGSLDDPGVARIERMKATVGEAISKIDLVLYRFVAPVLLLAGFIGFAWTLWSRLAKKRCLTPDQWLGVAACCGLALMAVVYAFGISWFSEFIYEGNLESGAVFLTFYGIGVIPMVYLSMLFGCALLLNEVRRARGGARNTLVRRRLS